MNAQNTNVSRHFQSLCGTFTSPIVLRHKATGKRKTFKFHAVIHPNTDLPVFYVEDDEQNLVPVPDEYRYNYNTLSDLYWADVNAIALEPLDYIELIDTRNCRVAYAEGMGVHEFLEFLAPSVRIRAQAKGPFHALLRFKPKGTGSGRFADLPLCYLREPKV